jgi:lipopolysaccharide biosynthesis glycosyltransferase
LIETAVVYFINEGYLLPAMVSAIQARKFSSRELIDVVIVCATDTPSNSREAISVAAQHGVEIVCHPLSVLEGRLPTFGRLIIHKLLPSKYKRLIYIDGDTQITGALDPLATAPLASGMFMAARDPGELFARISRGWRNTIEGHYRSGGYTGAFEAYFNAGVLVINREGWHDLSERTLALYDHAKATKHLDQDLMNRALSDHCVRISNRWNFPGFLIGSPMEKAVKPVIYHFMSNPRPWNEAVIPWGQQWMLPYDRLLAENPTLGFLKPKGRTLKKRLKYLLMMHYKCATEYRQVGQMAELPPEINL